MQNTVLQIGERNLLPSPVDSSVSFKIFTEYLQGWKIYENTLKAHLNQVILDKFAAHSELDGPISLSKINQYKELLELIYVATSPLTSNEKDNLWAMSVPLSHQIFYGTDSFYDLLSEFRTCEIKNSLFHKSTEELKQNFLWYIYAFLLNKFYHFTPITIDKSIYEHPHPNTGLISYYQLNLDNRFVQVQVKGTLPELKYELLETFFQNEDALDILQQHLPLHLFHFEGFTIVTLIEVTDQMVLSNIRSALLNQDVVPKEDNFQKITQNLKNLTGNVKVDFGLLPFFKINNNIDLDPDCYTQSILLQVGQAHDVAEEIYLSLANQYSQHPKPSFFSDFNPNKTKKHLFLQILGQAGIQAYAILPAFYNKELVGVIEVATYEKNLPLEPIVARLESALPLLSQLLQNYIVDFNKRVEAIIKDKFTSLQPAVQWKFNEVAWHYLKNSCKTKLKPELEPIDFEQVYPVYGAVDIRNSTLERNQALIADLRFHLSLLINTLTAVKENLSLSITDELIFISNKWMSKLEKPITSEDEIKITAFLEKDVISYLQLLSKNYTGSLPHIDSYFDVVQHQGVYSINRQQLETSIQVLNIAILHYLEYFRDELQASYPCYFETFRSDGVEYDIYLGQSIAPDKPFNWWYLKNLRLWQLNAMAAIAKLSKALLAEMPKPIETTQLIFVHAQAISISFRTDERRFDVEGAYNIQYEVVKKRIDKVHLKHSTERLTQPDKIAIVYFNNREAEEYEEYIQYLQEKGTLNKDLEYLDLEELQGISGLKALRVGVNYES